MRREGKKGGGGKSGGKRRGWSEWEKNVWKIGMRCSTLISTQIGGLFFLGKVQRDFGTGVSGKGFLAPGNGKGN